MIFYILRNYSRFLLRFLNKGTNFINIENFPEKGPLVLAPTHANSVIDAIQIACRINRPIWFLVRGDLFKKEGFVKELLLSCKGKPIFRPSEGVENMGQNDNTIASCVELFKENEAVLIFPEGLSSNQSDILPLKKGLARMAYMSKSEGIDLQISPITVNYENFKDFGNRSNVTFGKTIRINDLEANMPEAKFVKTLTDEIKTRLVAGHNYKFDGFSILDKTIYLLGWIMNFPLYFLAIFIANKFTKNNSFHDTAVFFVLFALYPIYCLILGLIYYFNF
jgi:1-acyl-sn-glycerol-3-phosphate acyltransferase